MLIVLTIDNSYMLRYVFFFFFSSRRRHTRLQGDWSSDVCSSDLGVAGGQLREGADVPVGDPLQQGNIRDRLLPRLAYLYGNACHMASQEGALGIKSPPERRSEERRVGKECRSRWSPYH